MDPAIPTRRGLDRLLHQAFEAGLALKALLALVELLSGLALRLVPTDAIRGLVQRLTLAELDRHPGDRVAAWLMHLAQGFSMDAQSFYAVYLAGHGLVKLVLVAALFQGWRWAYPVSIAALALFIAYQMHRYAATHAIALVLLSLFDAVMIGLIWREWRVSAGRGR